MENAPPHSEKICILNHFQRQISTPFPSSLRSIGLSKKVFIPPKRRQLESIFKEGLEGVPKGFRVERDNMGWGKGEQKPINLLEKFSILG